eukprot:6194263-Pleurochrysis_carterae.AAC.2
MARIKSSNRKPSTQLRGLAFSLRAAQCVSLGKRSDLHAQEVSTEERKASVAAAPNAEAARLTCCTALRRRAQLEALSPHQCAVA